MKKIILTIVGILVMIRLLSTLFFLYDEFASSFDFSCRDSLSNLEKINYLLELQIPKDYVIDKINYNHYTSDGVIGETLAARLKLNKEQFDSFKTSINYESTEFEDYMCSFLELDWWNLNKEDIQQVFYHLNSPKLPSGKKTAVTRIILANEIDGEYFVYLSYTG